MVSLARRTGRGMHVRDTFVNAGQSWTRIAFMIYGTAAKKFLNKYLGALKIRGATSLLDQVEPIDLS